MKKTILSIVILSVVIATMGIFYSGMPGESGEGRAEWKQAEQINTAEAYIRVLANTPTHDERIRYQYKAQRQLNELAVASLQGSCPMDELAFYSRELFGKLSIAEQLTPTAEMMGLRLYDTGNAGSANEVRIDFTTELIRDTYSQTTQPGIFHTVNAGRKLEGTLEFGDRPKQNYSYTYDPSSIFTPSESKLESRSLEIVFDYSFRPAFVKLLISECSPPAIAAFYLDFRDPDRIEQRPHFTFVQDAEIDDYLLANFEDVLPVLMSVADNMFVTRGAQEHVAVLFSKADEEDRLTLISALLHSSNVSFESALKALIEMDTPDSLDVLMERGVSSTHWSFVDINSGLVGPPASVDTYLQSKAGPELATMIMNNADNYSDSTLTALLEWTLTENSRPIYSSSDDPRIMRWLDDMQN